MKRENLKRANEIAEDLNELESTLKWMEETNYVSLLTNMGSTIKRCYLENNDLARSFISDLKDQIKVQIQILLIELETL